MPAGPAPAPLHSPDWDVARVAAHEAGRTLSAEAVALAEAPGRVLAADVLALTNLPAHDYSAMDGWAVAGAGPWRVVGRQLAGSEPASPLAPGEAVEIATGAAVPEGTLGVLRSEDGAVDPAGLLSGEVTDRQDIRPAGEEALAGEVLLRSGTRLTAAQVGLAAAAGHDRLEVVRRPTAQLLVFGDELLRSGPAGGGRVRDSLGPSLPSLLADLGVDLRAVRYVEDTLEAHVEALAEAAATDLVFTTGGTANGPVDFLHDAITRTGGQVIVDTVACRPGHPMLLAGWADRWLVGLPGNPQAAIVALLTLGAPLVAGCLGQPLPPLGRARISASEKTRGRATRLIPCRLERDVATPAEHIGSGMLRGLAAADGFAVVQRDGAVAGDEVDWLPLP